jgi:hypothetical protein
MRSAAMLAYAIAQATGEDGKRRETEFGKINLLCFILRAANKT